MRRHHLCNRLFDYISARSCYYVAFSDSSSRTTFRPPPNPSLVRRYSKLLAGLRMRWHTSMKTRRSDGCSPKPRLMRTYKMSLHTKMGSYESDGHCKHPEDVESGNRFLTAIAKGKLEAGGIAAKGSCSRRQASCTNGHSTESLLPPIQNRGCLLAILPVYQGTLPRCRQDVIS